MKSFGTEGKKIYFAADQHFGIPTRADSLRREQRFIAWLNLIKTDAEALFLMGDLFDFWFEYRQVIPRGYVRLLGKIAELVDAGIPIYYFRGNHDIWAFDYLQTEIGIHLMRQPECFQLFGKTFYLAHGDGLGKGDNGYKFLKHIFECPFNQWCFRWLHPDIGTALGWYFSRKSRRSKTNACPTLAAQETKNAFLQRLPNYCQQILETNHIDYFIFGHYHHIINETLPNGSHLLAIGDWMQWFSYGVFDGKTMEIKKFDEKETIPNELTQHP